MDDDDDSVVDDDDADDDVDADDDDDDDGLFNDDKYLFHRQPSKTRPVHVDDLVIHSKPPIPVDFI